MAYANYISQLIKDLFDKIPIVRPRKNERALDIQIFNKAIVDFIINKVGMVTSPKWGRARIPDSFLNTELERFVLRGYFDTDGSVVITNNNGTINPRLEMKICPSPMRNSLINILKKIGFRFGVYRIDNNMARIQINGKEQGRKWLKEVGIMNYNQLNKLNKVIAGEGFEPSTYTPNL